MLSLPAAPEMALTSVVVPLLKTASVPLSVIAPEPIEPVAPPLPICKVEPVPMLEEATLSLAPVRINVPPVVLTVPNRDGLLPDMVIVPDPALVKLDAAVPDMVPA